MKKLLFKLKSWFIKPFKTIKDRNTCVTLSTIIFVFYCSIVPFVACFTHWALCFLCPLSILIFFYVGYLASFKTLEENEEMDKIMDKFFGDTNRILNIGGDDNENK